MTGSFFEAVLGDVGLWDLAAGVPRSTYPVTITLISLKVVRHYARWGIQTIRDESSSIFLFFLLPRGPSILIWNFEVTLMVDMLTELEGMGCDYDVSNPYSLLFQSPPIHPSFR